MVYIVYFAVYASLLPLQFVQSASTAHVANASLTMRQENGLCECLDEIQHGIFNSVYQKLTISWNIACAEHNINVDQKIPTDLWNILDMWRYIVWTTLPKCVARYTIYIHNIKRGQSQIHESRQAKQKAKLAKRKMKKYIENMVEGNTCIMCCAGWHRDVRAQ